MRGPGTETTRNPVIAIRHRRRCVRRAGAIHVDFIITDWVSDQRRPTDTQLRRIQSRNKGRIRRRKGPSGYIASAKHVKAIGDPSKAAPRHHEPRATVAGNRRIRLLANGGVVNEKRLARNRTIGKQLGKNTFLRTVFAYARPDHQLISVRAADLWPILITVGVGVYAERPRRTRAVIRKSSRVDVPSICIDSKPLSPHHSKAT